MAKKVFDLLKMTALMLVMLICFSAFQGTFILFSDYSIFFLQFTNVSFAVFLALANVCFSWARSLDTTKYDMTIRRINRISIMCIFTAVFMIFTSFLTFQISNGIKLLKADININPIYIALSIGRFISLSIGLTLTVLIMYQLFDRGWFLLKHEYALIDKSDYKDITPDYIYSPEEEKQEIETPEKTEN